MTYDYYCEDCGSTWEEVHPMADRDKPVGEPCPHCDGGKKKRGVAAPSFAFDTAQTTIQKANNYGDWNCLLKKIHKNSGKQSKIHHE